MLRTSPPENLAANRDHDRERKESTEIQTSTPNIVIEDADGAQAHEESPLLPKSRLPRSENRYDYTAVGEVEQFSERRSRKFGRLRQKFQDAGQRVHTIFSTVVTPKQWDRKAIFQTGIVKPFKLLPSVFLGLLLNILDGLSYGLILFPLGEEIFSKTGPDGISIFFVSCIVSQLVYSSGFSIFKGGVGSEMIEVVPFFHKMAYTIMARMAGESPESILATVILAYCLSSIVTGLVFFCLGFFKLGSLVNFFPRSILLGCIGGVGLFLFLTGIEVSARIDGELRFTLDTLQRLIMLDTLFLWVAPLLLAIIYSTINYQRWITNDFFLPAFVITIAAVVYIVAAGTPSLSFDKLRKTGWIFAKPEAGVPFYHFYSLFNFRLTDWGAIVNTVPAMLGLSFFGVLHVPINVPALANTVKEDDVNLNQELIAHGLSNALSGMVGSIQNYLVYVNSVMFIKNGADSRLAGFMLAAATAGVWMAGPSLIGYIPVTIVGTLIYILGIDLLKEAWWDTFRRLALLEYLTATIALIMGLYDFVTGILVGIVLACLVQVVQTSRVKSVRCAFSGVVAESTVRRHPIQRHFLREVGRQTIVVKLDGYLFFGSIVHVESYVRSLIQDETFSKRPIKYVVIDFQHVTGLDFSAGDAFTRMYRLLIRKNVEMILSSVALNGTVGKNLTLVGLLDEEMGDAVHPAPKVFEDLNQALEWCENQQLFEFIRRSKLLGQKEAQEQETRALSISSARQSSRSPSNNYPLDASLASPRKQLLHSATTTTLAEHAHSTVNEQDILTPSKWSELGQPLQLILQTFQDMTDKNEEFWKRAAPYFSRRQLVAGQNLYSRLDDPDGFYLLEQGILRAEYDLEQGRFYESIVPGTTCGELPFFSESKRTSNVFAEKDCVVWCLDREGWGRLCGDSGEGRETEEMRDVAVELLKVGMKLTGERMEAVTSYLVVAAS
ncbi:hypothetical protein M501DRAFT_926949 [Patellaria atrata CBS 101060]|uniref:Sulfate transporter family protein n=1 Tax=Patellaria atrata CBS 101060 TaxID=1346257 RepID=A0A9P4SH30_9PEZI|nr:hypothetical protein M501DRAFT_926949 [Patellaria atrata CBS 101060]